MWRSSLGPVYSWALSTNNVVGQLHFQGEEPGFEGSRGLAEVSTAVAAIGIRILAHCGQLCHLHLFATLPELGIGGRGQIPHQLLT